MHTTTNSTTALDKIEQTWTAERAARPVPSSTRRTGYDTVIVDSHIVDPTVARHRAAGIHAVSPGAARLDAILGQ
jgi:hypothetical protein